MYISSIIEHECKVPRFCVYVGCTGGNKYQDQNITSSVLEGRFLWMFSYMGK
jgi:hypothetical protein